MEPRAQLLDHLLFVCLFCCCCCLGSFGRTWTEGQQLRFGVDRTELLQLTVRQWTISVG